MDVRAELQRRGAVLDGHFQLSSGRHSAVYVQCARALSDPRFAVDAGRLLADRVGDLAPEAVVSPALGGIIIGFTTALALGVPFVFTERQQGRMVLRRGQQLAPGTRVLVVEDVITTGGSAAEAAAVATEHGAVVVGTAALVDRSGGAVVGVRALVSLEAATFPPEECPMCAEGVPVESPGSRWAERR